MASVEGGLQLGSLFPVQNDAPAVLGDDPGQVDVAIQTRVGVGFRHDFFLGGVRFRGVFLPTVANDQAQTSMELFARGTWAASRALELFGEWRLNMNLDRDLGFAFDQLSCNGDGRCGGVWGMFFVVGAGYGEPS